MMLKSLIWLCRIKGWRFEGLAPEKLHCVVIGVPHTSNWDFVVFAGALEHFGIYPRFMGKDSLFRWPIGRFMKELGGISINRDAAHGVVSQMVAEFAQHEEFVLVIAPEGTRSSGARWKKGFYHIACQAGVPIVLSYFDGARKVAGLAPPFMPTGDYAADMQSLLSFLDERTTLSSRTLLEEALAGNAD
jgi:1-acyl-sn-glycerol-3-phosphate acyltransferase